MAETSRKPRFTKVRYTEAATADSEFRDKLIQSKNLKTEANLSIKDKKRQQKREKRLVERSLGNLDQSNIRKHQMSMLSVKIKHFDINNISEREKYLEVPLIPVDKVFNEKKEVHNVLTNIRKRYDEVKRVQSTREQEIQAM